MLPSGKEQGGKCETVIYRQDEWLASQEVRIQVLQNIQPFAFKWHNSVLKVFLCNDMAIGYAESLTATCPVFWISIAYVNETLNKTSLEPQTLQDIMLFTVIFYALYVCWKTGLETIKS